MLSTRLLTVFCLVFSQVLSAQSNGYWQPQNVPEGFTGNINRFNGDTCIAWKYNHTNSSVIAFRSTDRGVTWQEFVVPELADDDEGTEIFRVVNGGYFLKSLNYGTYSKLYRANADGQQWTLVNGNLPVKTLQVGPDGIMVGVGEEKLYRSINGGATWSIVFQHVLISSSAQITFWSLDTVSVLTSNKLFHSYDKGLNWVQIFPLPGLHQSFFHAASGTMFLMSIGKVTRSMDQGVTWDTVFTGNIPSRIHQLSGNRLWAMMSDGKLLESTNDGDSWQEILANDIHHPHAINTIYSDGTIIGQARNTVVRSTDSGASWSPSNNGLNFATLLDAVVFKDSIRWVFTPRGLWRSSDAGATWEIKLEYDYRPNSSYNNRTTAFWNADTLVTIAGFQTLMRSFDGGETFNEITPSGAGNNFGNFFIDTATNRLFIRTQTGIVFTENYGETWNLCLPGASLLIAIVRHPSGILMMNTEAGSDKLWFSNDGGTSWILNSTLDLSDLHMIGLVVSPSGVVLTLLPKAGQIILAKSEDLGQTWSYHPIQNLNPAWYNSFYLAQNDQIFVVGEPFEIWSSVDFGNSWFTMPPTIDKFSSGIKFQVDDEGFLYLYGVDDVFLRSAAQAQASSFLHGNILKDADAECSTPDAQQPLANWLVEAAGPYGTQFASTGTNGTFAMGLNPGSYTVNSIAPQNLWWSFCDSTFTVQIDSSSTSDTVNFIALPLADCPLMAVDVSAPLLRRCFNNSVYVQTCNVGTETAESAWIDIYLDPFLELVSSAQAHDSVGLNTWRFYVGDMPSGECAQFNLTVYVNCDSTVLGQTHCISARAFPDTLCTTVPNWSGANLEARVTCQDTTVHFELENTGTAPSQPLDYIIIVDDVVLMQGEETYDVDELLTIEQPANGQTWRIESQQEPGHPFSTVALAFAEGCGGFGSLGFVNQFSVNGITPSTDRFCLENIGAYDPNDKQGFPRGYGDDNRIAPGQDLEYLIRFQNTGTDTAFTVRIADTLSTWLDPASIVPGASSHLYSWSLSGEGIVTFLFENILLPDSNTNLAGSQGFVSFRIRQREQVPLNTVILNSAAIYFDFNAPVITNETRHTIGVDILNDAPVPAKPLTAEASVQVSPNPATDEAIFRLRRGAFQGHRMMVTDAVGRVVHSGTANGDVYRWRVQGLPRGWYAWQVLDGKGKQVEAGKIILK